MCLIANPGKILKKKFFVLLLCQGGGGYNFHLSS